MGGATSKFKETDWEKADGKLKVPGDTIDGAHPTSCYGVYYLTKKGVNQREFDVTDSESNLIYTTRQVPGTIACFDVSDAAVVLVDDSRLLWSLPQFCCAMGQVIGKEIDNHLLRITVDLARRYWTVYRFEEPAFEDQKPDKEATEKLVAERLQQAESDPMIENFNTPFLFRKAVVVVSWSRYMAVSSFYGPPTDEMLKQWENEQFATKQASDQSDNSEAPKKNGLIYEPIGQTGDESEGREIDTSTNSKDYNSSVEQKVSFKSELSDITSEEESVVSAEPNLSVELQDVDVNGSVADDHAIGDSNSTYWLNAIRDGDIEPNGHNQNIEPSSERLLAVDSTTSEPTGSKTKRTNFRTWAKQKSLHLREKSLHFRAKSLSALEKSGIITKTVRRDPLEGVIHLNKKPLLLCQEIYNRIIGNHQTSLISREKAIELLKEDIAQHEREDPEAAKKDEDEDPIMTGQEVILRTRSEDSGDGEPEHKSVQPEEDRAQGEPTEGVNWDERSPELQQGVEGKEQSLVGYWLWENTLRTHKMKMHVAQGADLALHVVLAIIVNQVRYERNALAMTI